jgi:hypothetical protein
VVLALGTLLFATSQLRFGIGALAWVAPIPFLRYIGLVALTASPAGRGKRQQAAMAIVVM